MSFSILCSQKSTIVEKSTIVVSFMVRFEFRRAKEIPHKMTYKVPFLNFFFEKSVLRWSGTSGSTQVTTYYLQCRHNIRIWDRKGADLTNFYMSNLCPADYHHCKMWEKTSHDMKKWDLFIGPGCGFEDSKAFVDRSLFIVEKLQFVIFF